MAAHTHPDLILGTAGHIDHGKSSLIQALTGTDPDRLAEEKSRGITIELGFAQLTLPDGRTMGVVDAGTRALCAADDCRINRHRHSRAGHRRG